MLIHYLLLILTPLIAFSSAEPLIVNTQTIVFTGKQHKQAFITVTNKSRNTEYYKVIVEKITVDSEGKVHVQTARNPKELGLLATPTKLILKPLQKKKVRLLSFTQKADDAQYFLVTLKRKQKPQTYEETKKSESNGNYNFIVNITTGDKKISAEIPAAKSTFESIKVVKNVDDQTVTVINQGNVKTKVYNLAERGQDQKVLRDFGTIELYPKQIFRLNTGENVQSVTWQTRNSDGSRQPQSLMVR